MTIPYDIGPDCRPSGEPFRNLIPRLRPAAADLRTYLTPTRFIPFDKPTPPAEGLPPLVSASWQRLMASLVGSRQDDMERREALEAAWRALPFDFGPEAIGGR